MTSPVEITMKIEDGREIDFTFVAGEDGGFDYEFAGCRGYHSEPTLEFCEACDQNLDDVPEDDISHDDHLKAHALACAAA